MYQLILTEKPNAAQKIAEALADGKPIKKSDKGVPYYEITRGKQDIVVCCAVGHLFSLTESQKEGWKYPIFEIKWVPAGDVNKESAFSKKYITLLKKLAKDAGPVVVATDYDVEGEVIGYNVVRFLFKREDASRMKFSTLTKPDIVRAYESMSPSLNWGQVHAGETRHKLDWFYGINTSRALTSSIKTTGRFKVMSTGRVQGPALKIIVEREMEIDAFKPEPFWQIELNGDVKSSAITAWHKEDKFWKKDDADAVMAKVRGAVSAKVSDTEKTQFEQAPPHPFDLTSLQIEAHRLCGISPKDTLAIAQDLYTSGYTSYPRTSSQQLPPEIGFKKIISSLQQQAPYSEGCQLLLHKSMLKPNNGQKTDPAHPAIYPTGITPNDLDGRKEKIYDLIVRRFLATFGEAAIRQTIKIDIDCKTEIFIAKGTTTVKQGWHILYGKYAKFSEDELPDVHAGDIVAVSKITLHDKETQPPKRYTESSIIKELERKNLGTKATRAQIVDTLFQRGYVDGKPIKPTDLGIRTCETLERYSPKILDEGLTRHFEVEMEEISENKKPGDKVLSEAKKLLTDIMHDFKDHEKDIGHDLVAALKESQRKATTLGACPVCQKGELVIRKGKFGMFVACNNHPECTTTFSLPANAGIQVSDKVCEQCSFPMIRLIRKGKQPQDICINKECPSKKVDNANLESEGKPCPKCKEGKLVLRKSVYGSFLGCSKYPACRYIEKI